MNREEEQLRYAIQLSLLETSSSINTSDTNSSHTTRPASRSRTTGTRVTPRDDHSAPTMNNDRGTRVSYPTPSSRMVPDIDEDMKLAMRLQQEEERSIALPPQTSVFDRFGFGYLTNNPLCSRCHQSGVNCSYVSGNLICYRCLRCTACSENLRGQFNTREDKFYCQSCALRLFSKTCSVCRQPLTGQYLKHSYFEEETYCIQHQSTQATCFCCSRLEPMPSSGLEPFVLLPDGRKHCMECCLTAVLDSPQAQGLYQEVLSFMEIELGLRLPPGMREVPILAVDLASLNEQHDSRAGSSCNQATVRGMTMYQCSNVSYVTPGYWNLLGNGSSTNQTVFHVEQRREVTAVLVLFGMPRTLTLSVLAHEAMHVYLKLSRRFRIDLPPHCEEGLCQVIAAKSLRCKKTYSREELADGGSKSERLRKFVHHEIEANPSAVYGDGYRSAVNCVDTLGLEITLDIVSSEGNLPLLL